MRFRWRTVVRRFGDRRDRLMTNAEPAALLEAGAQWRRLRRRPDDADLDAVRMRLVVGADDAEREQDHEEERDEHGAQREPRLLALLVLLAVT